MCDSGVGGSLVEVCHSTLDWCATVALLGIVSSLVTVLTSEDAFLRAQVLFASQSILPTKSWSVQKIFATKKRLSSRGSGPMISRFAHAPALGLVAVIPVPIRIGNRDVWCVAHFCSQERISPASL